MYITGGRLYLLQYLTGMLNANILIHIVTNLTQLEKGSALAQ